MKKRARNRRASVGLRVLYTHLTATYSGPEVSWLQGLLLRPLELLSVLDSGHPKAELVRVVMAVSFGAVALDERRRAEVLQTRSRTGQRLPAALRTGTGVLRTGIKTDSDRQRFQRNILLPVNVIDEGLNWKAGNVPRDCHEEYQAGKWEIRGAAFRIRDSFEWFAYLQPGIYPGV